MPKLFISYRRDDSAGVTGRLFDRLVAHFGHESVFMDVDSIPFGVDFRTHLADAVRKCDALLAVIGERWTTASQNGRVRLHDPADLVRFEIETALARNIAVIPILVGRRSIPQEEELPASLRPLVCRNACELDVGSGFHADVDRLVRALEQVCGSSSTEPEATDNLLHAMWDHLDPSLQDAFSLAYNKKRRQGGNRISTKDFFQALVRLGDDSVKSLLETMPEGALPEAIDHSVTKENRLVLEEAPLLSDCVADSLEHFKDLKHLPRKISSADMFVDIAKYGHGESVARLRQHGVDDLAIEDRVHALGLPVLRRIVRGS